MAGMSEPGPAIHHVTVALGGLVWLAALGTCGCTVEPSFRGPVALRAEAGETVFIFDADADRKPDYWQYQTRDGRKKNLAYADGDSGQPGDRIDLDTIDADTCPHIVILLDGVPFELLAELHRTGHFRLFYPPARVICCFPSMTDLALSELLHTNRCPAYQAPTTTVPRAASVTETRHT